MEEVNWIRPYRGDVFNHVTRQVMERNVFGRAGTSGVRGGGHMCVSKRKLLNCPLCERVKLVCM